jgi:hypothetical protein
MTRAGLLTIVLLGACGVGQDPVPNPTARVCTATMSVTGSFVRGVAPPLNPDGTMYEGCWGVGTWTFQATVNQNDCTPAPTMLPQYSFQGTLTTDPDTGDQIQQYAYVTDPSARSIVRVSAAANAACEGELSLYSSDGIKVTSLKPWLNPDNTIVGDGEFAMYTNDQWTNAQ